MNWKGHVLLKLSQQYGIYLWLEHQFCGNMMNCHLLWLLSITTEETIERCSRCDFLA